MPRTLVVVDGTWRQCAPRSCGSTRCCRPCPARAPSTRPRRASTASGRSRSRTSCRRSRRCGSPCARSRGDDPRIDGPLEPFRAMIRMPLSFQARAERGDPDVRPATSANRKRP
ncbi:MAG: hypothetical protein MZV63_06140 [Marinilabiliales bacterium]|nr:hypothetical protein [Marinilabiliales bacterium]